MKTKIIIQINYSYNQNNLRNKKCFYSNNNNNISNNNNNHIIINKP